MTTKISVYSLSDLKTTLDDHIPIFLTSPNLPPGSNPLPKSNRFVQSHTHTHIRLFLGYTSVLVALYIFYLDNYLKLPWSQHKHVTAIACVLYFVLNALFTLYIWFGERGIIFAGTRGPGKDEKSGQALQLSLRLSSHQPERKYDPVYRLKGSWSKDSGRETEEVDLTVPFKGFFKVDGVFVPQEFEKWLLREIPVIAGKTAIPTILDSKENTESNDEDAGEEETIVVQSDNTSSTSGATTGSTSAKKRTKRKE